MHNILLKQIAGFASMPNDMKFRRAPRVSVARIRAGRWLADESGVAASEFAAVLMPFLFLVLGIMGSGLQFFAQNALEHGVEAAGRAVRTGQSQSTDQLMSQFKTKLCQAAGSFIKCDDSHLRVLVGSWSDWASVTPPDCMSGTSMAPSTGVATDKVSQYSGGSGAIVMITACYKWDLSTGLFMYSPVKLSDGSVLMQSSTAFRTEPYSSGQ